MCDYACVKYRRDPISDEMIERLLSVEREDPDFDYAQNDEPNFCDPEKPRKHAQVGRYYCRMCGKDFKPEVTR